MKLSEYSKYNREERDLCAHLFRLLLEDQPRWKPLKQFLELEEVENPQVYCEVALIRDAYHTRKPDTHQFLNELCEMIAEQNEIDSYTHFSSLPDPIQAPGKTHPKQIYCKLKKMGQLNSEEDRRVYGQLRSLFNAKPDLVICTGSDLFIYEAKFVSRFQRAQMKRTEQIGKIWAKLLYQDLGFSSEPNLSVRNLGLAERLPENAPAISWEQVFKIAREYWSENDFSLKVMQTRLSS